MTYRELINEVLIRLREDTIATDWSGAINDNSDVSAYHKVIGDFKLAGNPIKMSTYKDEKTRGDIPDLDEHREKILKEFS